MTRRNAKTRTRTVVTWTAVFAGSAGLVAGSMYAVRMPDRSGQQATLAGQRASNRPPDALAAALVDRLGARTAGAYLDSSGRPVVTVTNATDAAMVRAAGAVPKTLTRSPATLKRITDSLRASTMGIPGTGWAVDPATAGVTVWTDESVTGARMAAVRRAARQLGPAIRMVRLPGSLRTLALGGDAIFGQGARCSLGFNVKRGGQDFFLTAGHCGNVVQTWTADQQGAQPLGTTVQSSFPGDDFALVRAEEAGEGAVNLYNGQSQEITEAGDAVVGQRVTRSGSTTGVSTGTVTAINATVNYPEGTVTGAIQTTVCAEPGDSGGSLFSGSTALGLTSGGSGDCRTGGVTFFQPVTEPLQLFDAEVS
ncbi:S1 family peptidase [Actinomadura spongiicola]|uniref:S1 family peptidase n=1 Tax=Actinomadura spongiicola TaxID=2303421 RepID=A0A372G768_9ACTN|nr:S1 family peptidase [Actinomadura spongiicola]RFS81238.1 S1 family peptidase [Actinomadura spongiicola]